MVKEQSMQHIHSHPSDCLVNLGFEFDDGGSREYWRDILHKDRHKAGAGDCSVIAASIALEQRYDDTFFDLHFMTRFRKENIFHFKQEIRKGGLGGLLRGIKHLHPKRSNPLYATYSEVLDHYLSWVKASFAMVYGEDSGNIQSCICDPDATFIVDGRFPGIDDHTSAIIDGVIRGEIDIGDVDFEVVHVWKMHPSIKAYRRQREEEQERFLEETRSFLQNRL